MIEVRVATGDDVPTLLAIYNHAVRTTTATFDLDEWTLAERMVWFEKFTDRYPLLVAVEAGEVVGYGCLSPFRDKPAYRNSAETSVYVHPEHQRKGIGRHLVEALVERARTIGFHTLIAGITTGNVGSVLLHEALGFQLVGTFRQVGYKFDVWQDVEFYQLMIEKPAL